MDRWMLEMAQKWMFGSANLEDHHLACLTGEERVFQMSWTCWIIDEGEAGRGGESRLASRKKSRGEGKV